ncbi:MAG: hypothetical protein WDW36_000404 [Sanguina aurantia]
MVWRDLSHQQLENIRHPHPKQGLSGRDLLSQYVGITEAGWPRGAAAIQAEPKNAINLDLYVHTLQFGQELRLSDDKLSGLFSIVKSTHEQSTCNKLTIEHSFTLLKQLLLSHSVQRPPYSIGLFTFPEMTQITEWMLSTYFTHYTLYQYVFTDRVTMDLTSYHPSDSIELPAVLPPLDDAITEQEHDVILADGHRQRDAAELADVQAKAAEDEAARQLRLREEYEAAIPDDIKDRVQEAVDRELIVLKQSMQEQFASQTHSLLAKITALEAKQLLAATPAS